MAMKVVSMLTLLLVASAAAVRAGELDQRDFFADVEQLRAADVVPRLLQELGLGDAPASGAYGQGPSGTAPGAYGAAVSA